MFERLSGDFPKTDLRVHIWGIELTIRNVDRSIMKQGYVHLFRNYLHKLRPDSGLNGCSLGLVIV